MIWKTLEKGNRNTKHNGKPLQQTRTSEDRISELEDEMEIKEKTEELLVKQHKTCKRKRQELADSIKRPNLRITGIEKDKRYKQKGFIIHSTKI
jgi:hypothetical protein